MSCVHPGSLTDTIPVRHRPQRAISSPSLSLLISTPDLYLPLPHLSRGLVSSPVLVLTLSNFQPVSAPRLPICKMRSQMVPFGSTFHDSKFRAASTRLLTGPCAPHTHQAPRTQVHTRQDPPGKDLKGPCLPFWFCAWGLVSVEWTEDKMFGGLKGKVSNAELSNIIQACIQRKPLCI